MGVKAFNFVRLEPQVLLSGGRGLQGVSAGDVVMEISEEAPFDASREKLKTVVTLLDSPSDVFNVYEVKHDMVTYVRDVYPLADPSSDDVEDRCLIRRREFPVFEFRDTPGVIYTSMPLTEVRRMCRRYEEEYSWKSSIGRRAVNLLCLEENLQREPSMAVVVQGYELLNVLLSTPVNRMDVDAERTLDNVEIQDAKTRAEKIRFLKLYIQAGGQMVSLRVGENGTVRFPNYPDDPVALKALERIEPVIQGCLRSTLGN